MHRLATLIALYGTKVLTVVSTVVVAGMLTYSGFVLYDTVYTNRAAFSSSDLTQYRPAISEEEEEPSFEEVQEVNKDTCAWIIMQGTNIDYPVVQGKDDVEYSMKDIHGKNSLTGSIYLTVANSKDFTNSFNMIYGHHMDNGAMFGDIEKYEDPGYFQGHKTGYLITTKGVYDLNVFASLSADAYDSKLYSAGDKGASGIADYLSYAKTLSMQWDDSFDIEKAAEGIQTYLDAREQTIAKNGKFVANEMPKEAIEEGVQLVACSTCADAETNGRQVLLAAMTVRTEPLPTELFEDDAPPLAAWGHGELDHWALLNLICAIMVIIILLPLRQIRNKYKDIRFAAKNYIKNWKAQGFKSRENRQLIGFLIELIVTVFSVFWFLWTEDMRQPMVIIDKWTLLMILLFAAAWASDVYLIRYKKRKRQKQESSDIIEETIEAEME